MIHVLHCITTLLPGGTEHYLLRHIQQTKSEIIHDVVVLRGDDSPLFSRFAQEAEEVHVLDMRSIIDVVRALRELREYISSRKPDVIHCWSYFPSLLSCFSNRGVPRIWNMRQTLDRYSHEKIFTALTQMALSMLRTIPDQWVYNAPSVFHSHTKKGLYSDRHTVIENGVNCDEFYRDRQARQDIRERLSIPETATVILNVGRRRPMKGISLLERVLEEVLKNHETIYVIVCGRSPENSFMHPRVIYRPYEEDIRGWFSAADIYCHSSTEKEGYPNVVAEAMACECIPVVTAVGHSVDLLGEYGICVDVNSYDELLRGVLWAIKQPGCAKGMRDYVIAQHSDKVAHRKYLKLYADLRLKTSSQEAICVE